MTEETIVAVYDTPAHAELAVSDLQAAGIPENTIDVRSRANMVSDPDRLTRASSGMTDPSGVPSAGTGRERGFWSSLFGGEPDHDTAVYDRSLESGSTVVTVRATDANVATVSEILERHHPVDMDERASGYGLTSTQGSMASDTAAVQPTLGVPARAGEPVVSDTREPGYAERGAGDQTLQLSAEEIAVGKRVVNRGGTRIRRFVVETPVEREVSLHDERVVVERRPVTDGRAVGAVDFGDRTIEMTESSEEAVVTKTARVVEEISLHKEATDRVETVRDTVRREDVEIEKIPGRGADETLAPNTPKKI